MLDYWVFFRREYQQPVRQCVFYIGTEPMRLPPVFEDVGTRHAYEVGSMGTPCASQRYARRYAWLGGQPTTLVTL